jgi:hypothetical protein
MRSFPTPDSSEEKDRRVDPGYPVSGFNDLFHRLAVRDEAEGVFLHASMPHEAEKVFRTQPLRLFIVFPSGVEFGDVPEVAVDLDILPFLSKTGMPVESTSHPGNRVV